jgi:hypothetical protein
MGANVIKAAPLRLAHAATAAFAVAPGVQESESVVFFGISAASASGVSISIDPALSPPLPPRTATSLSHTAAPVNVIVAGRAGNVDPTPMRTAMKVELARLVYEAETHGDATVRAELAAIVREARAVGVVSAAGLVNLFAHAIDAHVFPSDIERAVSIEPPPPPDATAPARIRLGRRISRWHEAFAASGSAQQLCIAATAGAILDGASRSPAVAGAIEILDRRASAAHGRVSAAVLLATLFTTLAIAVVAGLLLYNAQVASHRMAAITHVISSHRHAVIGDGSGLARGAFIPIAPTVAASAPGAALFPPDVLARTVRVVT